MDTKVTVTMDEVLVAKATAMASRQGWNLQDVLRTLVAIMAGDRTRDSELKLLLDQSQRPSSSAGGERLRRAWTRSDEYFAAHPPSIDVRPFNRDDIYADRILTPRRDS